MNKESQTFPMTDLEAIGTIVAVFEELQKRQKIATDQERQVLEPLLVRSAQVISHVRTRLNATNRRNQG
ncbi:hypothetical protein [Denitratimonas sp. CY0512]|uniref:hypothetical protein n=1 Tax=Denitratimonas sp. CY0512 TaxID=3131940 RepID=UPI0030998F58